MTVNKSFFLDLLKDRSMSLRTLAKRLDILPSQLSLTFSGVRRMQISEAVKIAQILGAPLNEVMVQAGIEEARTDRRRCEVIGFMNGRGEVEKPPQGEVDRTLIPEGLSADVRAVQARTAHSKLDWMDGFLMFCNGKQEPDELLGRLVWAKIQGGNEVIATVRRGYSPGTYNLSGPFVLESQRLEWAAQILLTKH